MDQNTLERARALAQGSADILPKNTVAPAADTQNPSERPGKPAGERRRVPMSVPVQRLAVPEIPGYHLHWFLGTPDRIQRAEQGGYEFVSDEEIAVNNRDLGGDTASSGNTDLGGRVSVVSGDEVGKDGQPTRLVLMKIRQEWWEEDQKRLEDQNERIAQAIRGGQVGAGRAGGETPADQATRYVKQTDNLFTRKTKR